MNSIRLQMKEEEYEEIKKLKVPGLTLTKSIIVLLLEQSKNHISGSWAWDEQNKTNINKK